MCFYKIRGFFIIDSPFPGPLVSALANKFGCRKVTILGSIVTALGFLVSTLAPSIEVLMFLYGVVGGWYSTIKVNVIALNVYLLRTLKSKNSQMYVLCIFRNWNGVDLSAFHCHHWLLV